MVHFLLLRWTLWHVYLSPSHFLRPSAASIISSHHFSLSLSSQPLCFLLSFVFLHCFMICLLWTRVSCARFLLCAIGEILIRLWCLLIVPLSNWDTLWSPSPWWHWQPVPLVTGLSPTETPERERDEWVRFGGKMEGRRGIRREKYSNRSLMVLL